MRITDRKTNFLICLSIFLALLILVYGFVFGIIYIFELIVDVGITSLICLIIVIVLLVIIQSLEEPKALFFTIIVFFVLLIIINGITHDFVISLFITLILILILVVYIMTRMSETLV